MILLEIFIVNYLIGLCKWVSIEAISKNKAIGIAPELLKTFLVLYSGHTIYFNWTVLNVVVLLVSATLGMVTSHFLTIKIEK